VVRHTRPGELTPLWTTLTIVAWAGILLAFAAIWNSSVKVGLSTWWLGPRSAPRPVFISFIPFVMPVIVVAAAARRMRYVPVVGIAASVVTAAIAAGDINRVSGTAIVEFVLAGAGLLTSLAAFSGLYRADRPSD
jgi:hypothetical protein